MVTGMRAGAALSITGTITALAMATPCLADGIISITNQAKAAVTVRIDGAFGCRAVSKNSGPTDMDVSNVCTFGATLGNHLLEFHYDDGKATSKSIDLTAKGYALTVTGAE